MDIKYTLYTSKQSDCFKRKYNDMRAIYRINRERFNETKTQNFKKTNWKKFLYSCGGYGGKCNCHRNWDIVKERNLEKNTMVKTLKKIKENNITFL